MLDVLWFLWSGIFDVGLYACSCDLTSLVYFKFVLCRKSFFYYCHYCQFKVKGVATLPYKFNDYRRFKNFISMIYHLCKILIITVNLN